MRRDNAHLRSWYLAIHCANPFFDGYGGAHEPQSIAAVKAFTSRSRCGGFVETTYSFDGSRNWTARDCETVYGFGSLPW